MAEALDRDVTEISRQITDLAASRRARLLRQDWWSDRMLDWAMSHPSFKTQMFRFVDVFPATVDDADVLEHLDEYSELAELPHALDLGLELAGRVPLGKAASASVARRAIARMAGQFIIGTTPEQAVDGLTRLWRQGRAATVDVLGEKTVTSSEADDYAGRVTAILTALIAAARRWPPDDHLERDDTGPIPRVNVSVKPTALSCNYSPLARRDGIAEAGERLLPILRTAHDNGVTVNFDMEHYDVKDVTHELFTGLVETEELADLEAAIVVQAYLKDSYRDLEEIVAASARRRRPLTVRLVKGAYFDSEAVVSAAEGWPIPVFQEKGETDANYERCVRLLHDHHGEVRAAFASHNVRSLAYAIAHARANGIADSGFEIQMLYGMAEPTHAAIAQLGFRLRVYTPVGELVPGMSYLVRRLLENTSNESFLRNRPTTRASRASRASRAAAGVATVGSGAAAARRVTAIPPPEPVPLRAPTDPARPGPYRHEPHAEWRRAEVRSALATEIAALRSHPLPLELPALIGGEDVLTAGEIASLDPSRPEQVVAVSASCGRAEAERALEAARQAWPTWWRTPAAERAAVLFRAAEWMRERRFALAALEVLEAGKPWAEADADVCEAIDFCEYYARRSLVLAAGGEVESPPGESNSLTYEPMGIGVVIAPWNFPLAIPTGMVVASLVTGNAVVFKPAEQTPAVAARLVEALRAGGLPEGVLAFLPGRGEDVGAYLVTHPDVSFVVFTGSRAVGLGIIEQAAVHRPGQRSVKRVVAEMGGKNTIVVDADADLDEAVPIVVGSAFGYSGQKCSACSRLVVVDPVHDRLVERLVGAAEALRIGDPSEMGVAIGPLVDEEALERVRRYQSLARVDGKVVLSRDDDLPGRGYFAAPTIVTDVARGSRLVTDEIFGPLLVVLRARSFDEAVEIANDTDYALTAGVISRSPRRIARATAELRAGNVYVNRSITGAVVGRQPFGGYGLSGVGSKAGGPDYLHQFVEPRVTTENTLRQGFTPEAAGAGPGGEAEAGAPAGRAGATAAAGAAGRR